MNEKPTYPNPWNPDDPAEWRPVTRTWAFTRQYKVPKELERLMWAGKLNQQCPYCNHVEPAGAFCHNCERQVTPDSYFQSRALDENGKPRRGRPRKEDMNKMVGVTNGNA